MIQPDACSSAIVHPPDSSLHEATCALMDHLDLMHAVASCAVHLVSALAEKHHWREPRSDLSEYPKFCVPQKFPVLIQS